MKLKNLISVIKSQMPMRNLLREFFVTKNAWGLFNKNSHINKITKKQKIAYSNKKKAIKAAEAMSKKNGCKFSAYKCVFCDGWHIGKDKI